MVLLLLVGLVTADLPRDVEKAAGCTDERPCALTEDLKAGTDGTGAPLRVYHLSRGPHEAASGAECELEEYWLTVGAKSRKVKLLLSLCNDGYGSAAAGEDDVKVKPNRLIHEQFGGGSFRISVLREFQLEPPLLLSTSLGVFDAAAPQFADEFKWSWESFSGEASRYFPKCTEEGEPDLREGLKPRALRSVLIPRVPVTKKWVEGGWKEAGLGECAARAKFVLQGGAPAETDTGFKVLAFSATDYVFDITDDKITAADELQVWLAEQDPQPWTGCLGPGPYKPMEWKVQVSTGQGRPATNARFGAPITEVLTVPGGVRLKLKLPEGIYPLMTFVYADSDDGKTIERTMSTSQLQQTQVVTLGTLLTIDKDIAICDVDSGLMQPRRPPLPKKGALFPGKVADKK